MTKSLPVIVPSNECPPGYEPQLAPNNPGASVMPKACHDCAFREGQPEQANDRDWNAIMNGVDVGRPFWCHQGMPVDATGAYSPTPQQQAEIFIATGHGGATSARICAGWLAMRGRFLWVRRADLVDALNAAPLDYPETFVIAYAAIAGSKMIWEARNRGIDK